MELGELKELGLSKGEIAVYAALLDLGRTALNKIHERTGIERRNIYDLLNKLIGKGLISYTFEKGKRTYQCTSPEYLSGLLKKREETLAGLKKKMPEITELFNTSKTEVKAEVYQGNEALKSLLSEVVEYKESYWLGGNSFEHYKAVPKSFIRWFTHWMTRRVEKKHLMRDLVSYGTCLRGLEPHDVKKHKTQYYKYCTLPKKLYLPMVVIIFGNKVAQVTWGEQPFAFVIDSPKVKTSFLKYFHYFWTEPW